MNKFDSVHTLKNF